MDAIEYKEVGKVQAIPESRDFLVRVRLTEKPDEEWIEAFVRNARLSIVCPAARVEGSEIVFVSGHGAIRNRILNLRRVINRTNNDFATVKEVPPLAQPSASDRPTAEEIEAMLKKEGL